jgi:hypothetical protein
MQAHEIYQQAGPALAAEVLGFFRENERNVYKTVLATLAQQRNLRAQFIQQKPVAAQIEWLGRELARRSGEGLAEQSLQVWLLQARQAMLVKFLDALGVVHDGKGAVDDLPAAIEMEALAPALDALLAEFPARDVTVYLHMFQRQQPGGWPAVADVLANDPRLQLAPAAAGGEPA